MKIATFLHLLKNHKFSVIIILALSVVIPILEASSLGLIYLLISPEKAQGAMSKLSLYLGLPMPATAVDQRLVLFGITLAVIIAFAAGRWFHVRLGAQVRYSIYEETVRSLVDSLLGQSAHISLREDKDNFANLVVNEGPTLAGIFFSWIQIGFGTLAIIVLSISTIFYIHYLLILLALSIGFISTLINRSNLKSLQSIGTDKVSSQKELMGAIRHLMDGLYRIKFDSLEDFAQIRLRQVVRNSSTWRVAKNITRANIANLADSFNLFSIAVLVLVGTIAMQIDPAVFVALLLIINRLRSNVTLIQAQIMNIKELMPGCMQVQATMDRLFTLKTEPQPLSDRISAIELEDVDFSYDDQGVLHDINLALQPGDKVLIQGPSGQGKSTLLKMLTGLLPPNAGSARYRDNQGWHELNLEAMRDQIFFCDSDLFVFSASVSENLDPLGKYTDQEIADALRKAGLHEEIDLMPQGVLSNVGENGSSLSQGQRQRLLLARVFLKNPSLVILDEATANLDLEKEKRAVQNLVQHLDPDAILLVATHRKGIPIYFNKVWKMSYGRLQAGPKHDDGTDA